MSAEEVSEVVSGKAADDAVPNGGAVSAEDAALKVESGDTPNLKESQQSPAEGEAQAAESDQPDAEGESAPSKADEGATEEPILEEQPVNGESDAVEAKPERENDEGEAKPADGESGAAADKTEPEGESDAGVDKTDGENDVGDAKQGEVAIGDASVEGEEKDETTAEAEGVKTGEESETTTTTTTTVETIQMEGEDGGEGTMTVKETITVVKTTKVVEGTTEEIDHILKEIRDSSQLAIEEPQEEQNEIVESENEKQAETIPVEEEILKTVKQYEETEPEDENVESESPPDESEAKEDADLGGDAISEEPTAPGESGTLEEQKTEPEDEKDVKDSDKDEEEKPSDEVITTEVETETPTTVIETTTVTTTVTKKPAKRQIYTAGRRTIPKEEADKQKPDSGDEVVDEDIEALKNKLKVKSIDLRSYSNQKAHHTDDYDVYNVVLRRGQQFEVKVGFEHAIKLDENEIYLVICLGESPKVTDDTRINIPVGTTVKRWRVDVIGVKEEEMSLRIQSPSDAPVGKLNIGIGAMLKPSDDPLQWKYVNLYEHDEHLYLLFNPWCRDDTVFLDNDDARQEYVLNDGGILFEGSHSNPKKRPWNFGQFDTFVVLATFHLLETGLPMPARSSSAKVARTMSAMVNAEDNDGVLIGNWSGDYSKGKAPSEWAGSVEILSTYKTSERPVGYAQCAEYSGVLTSVLRCLGIPTRSVTAYSAAQDTDGSMTVDVHWDQNYQPYAKYNTDTVWVHHVYNECYMARPDLHKGKKFRGWQVIDGTPAERSDGIFQTGPAPVNAIKRGNVSVKYDTEYSFAMVNADRVHWMIQESGGKIFDKRILHKEPSSIGRRIVTKAIGSDDIDNVTSLYKHPEGSKEERRAVSSASASGTVHKKYFETVKAKDFDMKIKFPANVKIGDDLNLKIHLRNRTDVEQLVDIYVECYGAYYTGVLQDLCKKEKLEATLPPGHKAKNKVSPKDKIVSGVVTAVGSLRRTTQPAPDPIGIVDVPMAVYFEDYKSFIRDHTALKFFIVAVRKTPQRHEIALQDEIMLQTPTLKMTVADPSKLKRDEEFTMEISFTNPLPIYLTDVRFTLEGLRFQQTKTIQHGDIGPENDIKVNFNLTPKLAGRKVLVANLESKELHGVSGAIQLEIQL
ncbi:protein-glutamine gamma-glutamyltransferase K-like [Ptychodera flava]|uniref:protein-glutamine gamma-glutamyltransferase K-like n=1 Tax=Ptychodera flava TaxID=63121 RepID=UPI003969CCE3